MTIAGGCFAAGAGAAALSAGRSGALPGWLCRSGIATALLQLVTLPGLVAEDGPWAAGGIVALVAFVALVVWFGAVTVVMLRAQGVSTAAPSSAPDREHTP